MARHPTPEEYDRALEYAWDKLQARHRRSEEIACEARCFLDGLKPPSEVVDGTDWRDVEFVVWDALRPK
jgi:hypothetical protein